MDVALHRLNAAFVARSSTSPLLAPTESGDSADSVAALQKLAPDRALTHPRQRLGVR